MTIQVSAARANAELYAGETLIHAYANAGKCCEHIIDDAWASRIVRVYRVKGLV